jgi:hypothetical protein
MPQEIGLWVKPIVYLVAMFALAFQTEHVGRRVANLLPPDERKGAWGYDPNLFRTLKLNESPWRAWGSIRTRQEINKRHKGEAAFERIWKEQQRWLIATLVVAVLGLPLL